MKKLLFLLSFFALQIGITANNSSPSLQKVSISVQQQVSDLDEQILRKKNLSDLYRAKAVRAKNQGDRLQFNANELGDARRYWAMEDYYNQQADILDQQIQQMQAQRKGLLKDSS